MTRWGYPRMPPMSVRLSRPSLGFDAAYWWQAPEDMRFMLMLPSMSAGPPLQWSEGCVCKYAHQGSSPGGLDRDTNTIGDTGGDDPVGCDRIWTGLT